MTSTTTVEASTDLRSACVLLAEDEESFVEALVIGLGNEGFRVVVARDGVEALRLFEEASPDVILLDLMLPKLSGLDVCRSIRARSNVPIIMVTAKGTEIDTVVALEVGADDYVTKPYRLRELVARMRAVIRRSPLRGAPEGLGGSAGAGRTDTGPSGAGSPGGAAGDPPGPVPPLPGLGGFGFDAVNEGTVRAGEVVVDLNQRRVYVRDEEVHLRRKEFELLRILAENAGRVMTRDVLIDRVWGTDYIGDTKTLDVHVKRLRTRVEQDPSNPRLITTIRGVGYRFDVSAPRAEPSSSLPPR